jgi:hypothetical protein
VAKAVYCTFWDGDLVIDVDSTGTQIAVRTERKVVDTKPATGG